MKRFLQRLGSLMWKTYKCVFYMCASAYLVLFQPSIAVAFVGVWIAKKATNEYERVIVSAAAGVVVAFLIFNFAELAILATVLPVQGLFGAWGDAVAAA